MGLNIKNERVHSMARTAARRTGATQTGAIETALERYLADLDAEETDAADSRRTAVSVIVGDMRNRLRAAGSPNLSADDLYDETGMPA